MKHTYNISGMTCSSCQAKVETLLSKIEGVAKATTNLASGTVAIEMNKHVATENLQAALKDYPKYQLSEMVARLHLLLMMKWKRKNPGSQRTNPSC
ncbi:MAG: heavy metal-associated domain-containing protein [Ferruginibacter sp.]